MSVESVLAHHLESLAKGDIDQVIADYAPDAVVLTPEGPVIGHDQLRQMFGQFVEGVLPPGSQFEMMRSDVDGDLAYIVWKASSQTHEIPLGTDTFVFADDKIVRQTYAGYILSK